MTSTLSELHAEPKRYSPDDLLCLESAARMELVDGRLVEKCMSIESCTIAAILIGLLESYLRENRIGVVAGADCSFQCFQHLRQDPERIRTPDVSYISLMRLTQEQFKKGHSAIPPDLAVEIVSPNDLVKDHQVKVDEYFGAGVQLVWVIYPETETVQIMHPDGSDRRLKRADQLDGEQVNPGFQCRVSDLFPEL